MPSDSDVAFADNWAYLRTELNWLDRLLRQAYARSQQETKEIERVARSKGDRATSHWWKGIITLPSGGYDDHHAAHTPTESNPPQTYQQQLEGRILASYQRGVALGLPQLCDRLGLTVFEKNTVLIGLAPEVNRRFSRLYGYLQGDERGGLPTVDLILRLLCRGDVEWRAARMRLSALSPLRQLGLVEFLPSPPETFLVSRCKLSESLINYLLADVPDEEQLETLLVQAAQPAGSSPQRLLRSLVPHQGWSNLVLPPVVRSRLMGLIPQWQSPDRVEDEWGFGSLPDVQGSIILLVGGWGTGKSAIAQAMAHTLEQPLFYADLALLNPQEQAQLLREITASDPPILLLKSAQCWLSRQSVLNPSEVAQLFQHRRQQRTLTFLSMERRYSMVSKLKGGLDAIVELPLPSQSDRLLLWKQAFPPQAPLESDLDWGQLAKQWQLTGGEIRAIARQAAFLAAAETPTAAIGMRHLNLAWEQKNFQGRYRRS
ncbi:MAG: hypothetical protein LRZ84_08280 [Desertifilum sp.]|nr:hypothetical protein [Desertifilum sp.]